MSVIALMLGVIFIFCKAGMDFINFHSNKEDRGFWSYWAAFEKTKTNWLERYCPFLYNGWHLLTAIQVVVVSAYSVIIIYPDYTIALQIALVCNFWLLYSCLFNVIFEKL